jgi:uncharacterized protein
MLSTQQVNIIIDAMKPYNPIRIGIFGSVARGENTNESDIDILYEFNHEYTLFDLAGLQLQLQAALKKHVDLVEFTTIHPKLKKHILPDVKMVYGE